jgi:hypothetical protein
VFGRVINTHSVSNNGRCVGLCRGLVLLLPRGVRGGTGTVHWDLAGGNANAGDVTGRRALCYTSAACLATDVRRGACYRGPSGHSQNTAIGDGVIADVGECS